MIITVEYALVLGEQLGVDFDRIPLEQFRRGVEVELEHTADPHTAAQIAFDHLNERVDYYERLALVEGRWFDLQGKVQWIRVADVVFIGPLMIAGGASLARRSPLWGGALILLGALTIGFNGYNWWTVHRSRTWAGAGETGIQN